MSIRTYGAWLLLALLSGPAQADVYRCRGPNGETVISDKACGVVEQRKKSADRKPQESEGWYYQREEQSGRDVGASNVKNYLDMREREKAELADKRRQDDQLAQEQRYERKAEDERRAYEKCQQELKSSSATRRASAGC